MAARALVAHVRLGGRTWAPGEVPPPEVARRITNPAAWSGTEESAPKESSVAEPPESGPGSGRDAWRAHADLLDVEVPEDATRDEIVALVRGRDRSRERV